MSQKRVRRLEDAPYSRCLVRSKRDCLTRTGKGQVVAVKCPKAGVVELVVVKTNKPLSPIVVRPNPFFEPFFDLLLLVAGRFGRLRVDVELLGLRVFIVNRRRL